MPEELKLGEEKELENDTFKKTHIVVGFSPKRYIVGYAYNSKNKKDQINIVIFLNGNKTLWLIKPNQTKKNEKSPDYINVLKNQKIIGYNAKNKTVKLLINIDGKNVQKYYLFPNNAVIPKHPPKQQKLGG